MRETDEKAEKIKAEEKGIQKGIEMGEKKGEKKRNLEIAKNAIRKGFDNQTISELTGLSIEEIEALRKEI
ncbi:MAG: hypothetical protein NZ516_12560 [Raineya sp.]|nr:hypothetical protein [Raineya sp.]